VELVKLIETDCVISGGGPAGMMLGLILARNGVDVVVVEKHGDFFRDFRGDTIHPSTIGLLGELGLRDGFLELPHNRIRTLDAVIDGNRIRPIDFGRLPPPDDFLVLAPQWDFLNFLAEQGASSERFHLLMSTEASDVIVEGGAVRGIIASDTEDELEIRATLTVAADGRDSAVRAAAGLRPTEFGVPIDVLWFRLPKPDEVPPTTLAYLDETGMVLTIDRGDYYQSGMVIRKGDFAQLQAEGIDAFRDALAHPAPFLRPVVGSITSWDQVKLLSVQVNRLETWHRPGLLCIGDAAHAMSPVFGVGVNYAIQDAVATANLLTAGLRAGAIRDDALAAVQARRLPPVKRMQGIQLRVHRVVASSGGRAILPNPMPAPLRWLLRIAMPLIQRFTARMIGRGFRPEHLDPALRGRS
jgi:2-polyprenyl-6-methoxyphenol hydroxylase-like FAD-dependent oxidoreductase